MNSKPRIAVVLPNFSPIDKYVAFKRVLLDMGAFFHLQPVFCAVNFPSPEDYRRWKSVCDNGHEPILIDVGDQKYHKGFRSAAEMQKLASSVEGGRTWNWLSELASRNNEDGNLKQARYSIAKSIREIYHVMQSGETSQEVVFDHGMDVVNGFFWRQSVRDWNTVFSEQHFIELKKLWDGFGVTERDVLPFTLPMYFRQLFCGGRPQAEITAKISWWLEKNRIVQKRHHEARKILRPVKKNFQVGNRIGGVGWVGDYFEARAFSYQWIGSGDLAIAIMRNQRRQVMIQSSFRHPGADFSKLYAELVKKEPGKWYLETRFKNAHTLMNGSDQYTGVTPTDFSDDQLIDLVIRFAEFN